MDDDASAAEAAFLEFYNTFDIPHRINSLGDLVDGVTLSDILHEIDPDFFQSGIPDAKPEDSSHWVSKWKALQHIHKECLRYIREEHDEASALHKNPYPNLRDIATGERTSEMNKACFNLICPYFSSLDKG
ncbi:MAG: hypothetical protein M4579_004775 [Chaenotheca gracillima]|nr:MAG: hypothetical protein M4579_004775 [Chaenotheca gracillima]